MRGWRNKLLVLLFVYSAGFATAIYALVPGSYDLAEEQGRPTAPKSFVVSFLKSDDFAHRFRVAMDKCLDLGQDASRKAADIFAEKFAKGNKQSDG